MAPTRAQALEVRTRRHRRFRRVGMWFGPEPVRVSTMDLSPAQVEFLLASAELDVRELEEPAPPPAVTVRPEDLVDGARVTVRPEDLVEEPASPPAGRGRRGRR